ncbi:MAG TPA: Fe-S protein assembly co-chaperone HscB [Polyangia bacterium]|jgi:molecular chaperone HscB|nr:Fe-S protein assembly co-chaperone HscB [Polyangia bacterium]
MICWSCQKQAGTAPFCGACGALQPPDDGADLFAVLGQGARFAVDLTAAEAAYKDLSRQLHPDRFATADARARRASLARTVQLNLAWHTLRDPVRRAEYLLLRAGIDISEKKPSTATDSSDRGTHKVAAPPAFLLEILELNDELAAAKRAGDTVKVAFMAEEMRARARESMSAIGTALDAGAPGKLEEAARSLVALRYYQRFIDHASGGLEGAGA